MKLSYEEYTKGTDIIIEESKKEKEPYKVKVLDREFVVLPNVFSPKYFTDTKFFAEMIPFKKGKSFLEVGPGTGTISVFAALNGMKVTCVDINPDAVKNTKENAKLHGVNVEVFQGNVYDPLPEGKKFDVIFWNTPFALDGDKNITDLQKSVKDPGYVATKKFIFEAKDWLEKDGELLIGFSDVLGKPELLLEFIKKAGFVVYNKKTIKEMETNPITFDLYFCKS